jgi:hypothetical protein
MTRSLIEAPAVGSYFVESWENIDTSSFTYELDGCLSIVITRLEIVECTLTRRDFYELVMRKLMPLVFLHMPVHDDPR